MRTTLACVGRRSTRVGAGLLFVLAGAAAGCTTYDLTIEPAPPTLPTRVASARRPLTIAVESTYAPFVDGALSTTDRYPRDHELGRQDSYRYLRAFESTQQFSNVKVSNDGDGLHCRLAIVSGREPSHELRRIVSVLFTLGQLSHEQREIVQLEAKVSAPGRGEATYRLQARITSHAVIADATRLRRPWSFDGPENDLVAALVAHLAQDGWLDPVEGSR